VGAPGVGVDHEDFARPAREQALDSRVHIGFVGAAGVVVTGMAGRDLAPVVNAGDALDIAEDQSPAGCSARAHCSSLQSLTVNMPAASYTGIRLPDRREGGDHPGMTTTNRTIVLASGSPRRLELLSTFGLPFSVITSGVDEEVERDREPAALVTRLA